MRNYRGSCGPAASSTPLATLRQALVFALVLVLALVLPYAAVAQGRIAGVVRDVGGDGIVGAEITVAGTPFRTLSNDSGRFTLAQLPAGPVTVHVRRLGFAPASAMVLVQSGTTVPLTLTVQEVAAELAPVLVRRQGVRRYTGELAGFYERRDLGFGHFITGEEIEQRHPMGLTDLLRTVPGIQVSSPSLGDAHVRIRGNQCAPAVWLDGMPAVAAEFDLDALVPRSVAAIEIYSVATVPPQFVVPFGPTACGTILIWSRSGRSPRHAAVTAAQLDSLVASLSVRTADQVDVPARADPAALLAPVYPGSLYRGRVPGRVVVEFVVDTAGLAEMPTFGVVSSTDALFTDAVLQALPAARFTPAELRGRAVRQVVRQAVVFDVGAGVGKVRP